MIVVQYAQRNVDIAQIYERLMADVDRLLSSLASSHDACDARGSSIWY